MNTIDTTHPMDPSLANSVRFWRRSFIYRLAAGLALAGCLLLLAWDLSAAMGGRANVDGGEAAIMAMVQRMSRENVSMAWMTRPPFTLTCYGPAYYWLIGALAGRFFTPGSVLPGRLISYLAVLATVALIAGYVYFRTKKIEIGLFSACAFLLMPAVSLWGYLCRTDSLAVFFSVLACLAATLEGRPALVVAALAIVAGSLVKQTVALMAVPLALFWLVNKERQRLLLFLGLTAAGGLLAWGLLLLASGGYYYRAAILANMNRMSLNYGLKLTFTYMQHPLMLAALATAFLLWLRDGGKAARRSLLFWCFIFQAIVQSLMICKEGSYINYFLEPSALGAILLGLYAVAPLEALSVRKTAPALIAFAILAVLPEPRPFWEHAPAGTAQGEVDRAYETIAQRLRGVREPVLSDGVWLEAVLRAGALPYVNDSYLYRLMADNETLAAGDMVRDLERGAIKKLILDRRIENHLLNTGNYYQRWPTAALKIMQRNYVLEYVSQRGQHGLVIYRYKMG